MRLLCMVAAVAILGGVMKIGLNLVGTIDTSAWGR
jgi:hypothetical protein